MNNPKTRLNPTNGYKDLKEFFDSLPKAKRYFSKKVIKKILDDSIAKKFQKYQYK